MTGSPLAALAVITGLLAAAPAAVAAPSLSVAGPDEVRWGTGVRVTGAADAGVATPLVPVRIEVLPFPFTGAWERGATVTAGGAGTYAGAVVINRNSRLRAVVAGPAGDVTSPEVTAYATPRPVASTVRLAGRFLVRRLVVRLPDAVTGTVPTGWVAFAGARTDRRLRRVAAGTASVAVRGGVFVFERRVRVTPGAAMSGGFCEAPDFASVGFGRPATASPCPAGTTARRSDLVARVPEVTVISDSVGTGLDYVSGGRARATGDWSAVFDLKVCRRLVAPPCPPDPPSALSAIRSQPGSLGDVVVIHVGYNDWREVYDIGRVMAALRARGVRRVVWLTLQEAKPLFAGINAMVRRAAGRYSWLQVADWRSYSAGHPWFAGDGEHLTPSGAYALAGFYRSEIARAIAVLESAPAR